MPDIASFISWYAVFIFSITLHEAVHGFVAKKLGDTTAHHYGLVTLDPIPHIKKSPFGMLIIPIVSYFLNGWMIGWASTVIDSYWARQNRKKDAIVSIAGPAANLVLVIVAAIIIRAGMMFGFFYPPESITFEHVTAANSAGIANTFALLVSILFSLNLILCVFNLIPLPPLDGSGILKYFLSNQAAERYDAFLTNPTYSLIGLIIAWQIFSPIFEPILTLALNLLYPGTGYQ